MLTPIGIHARVAAAAIGSANRHASTLGLVVLQLGAAALAARAGRGDVGVESVVRVVLVALAAPLGVIMTDAAAITLAASPTPLRWRSATRAVVGASIAGVGWLVVVAIASARISGPVLIGSLSLQFTAIALVVIAAAAVAARLRPGSETTWPGAITMLCGLALSQALAFRFRAVPMLGQPGRTMTWSALIALAGIVIVWSTRDPATTPFSTTRRFGGSR